MQNNFTKTNLSEVLKNNVYRLSMAYLNINEHKENISLIFWNLDYIIQAVINGLMANCGLWAFWHISVCVSWVFQSKVSTLS